ncbi:hypothetical protein NQ317_016029 [Molorchus minor]|uniref:Uncharacterized protein n=1 Tax=Molorchus minor TaxID=1323400 RepID=A0ABQ9J8U1_9CUCU|nr:hypothetical protein NQ317_016029 [Molorchus minor]
MLIIFWYTGTTLDNDKADYTPHHGDIHGYGTKKVGSPRSQELCQQRCLDETTYMERALRLLGLRKQTLLGADRPFNSTRRSTSSPTAPTVL